MLRIKAFKGVKKTVEYLFKSDGGYYVSAEMEWIGKGKDALGLTGKPTEDQVKRLMLGRNPFTGERLRAGARTDGIVGWDVSTHNPKKVTIAQEMGDWRLYDAQREAEIEAFADVESYAKTRVRIGGEDSDRWTGNVVGMRVPHRETRPNRDDLRTDPHGHSHLFMLNWTFDPVENRWKALKVREIYELRKYLDRRYEMRFAAKVAALGYDIETLWETKNGKRRYLGWDIKDVVPDAVKQRFSRRTSEIEELADTLGIKSVVAKDKLGATSRLHKRDDLTLEDERKYWRSKITPEEKGVIEAGMAAAEKRAGRAILSVVSDAVSYAMGHEFERSSVVPVEKLQISAMERSMGHGLPDEVMPEALRQGLLVRDGQATTREVLEEERRMIGFAVAGRGTVRPLGSVQREHGGEGITLTKEQQGLLKHVMESPDRVVMIVGDAGTTKTTMAKVIVPEIEARGIHVTMVAPSAEASRGVLRREGFDRADTLAQFLANKDMQKRGGVIWVDEAGMVGTKTMARLFQLADQLNARVILMGDKKQLASVERGSPLRVLEEVAHLPVGRLKEIWRQKGAYKEAVKLLAGKKTVEGLEAFKEMGWVKALPEGERYAAVAKDYVDTVSESDDPLKACAIVCPTHAEGAKVDGAVRAEMKERGLLGDDRVFETYVPTQWTEAERCDPENYTEEHILRFQRATGGFRSGAHVGYGRGLRGQIPKVGRSVSVYTRSSIRLAKGDHIRITAGGFDLDGKRLDNGQRFTVGGFTDSGDIVLSGGRKIGAGFGHIAYDYANTAYAAQGRTVNRVILVSSAQSIPAQSQEAFYVGASRGKKSAVIYTDDYDDLKEAVQRSQVRLSATELVARKPWIKKARERIVKLRKYAMVAAKSAWQSREMERYESRTV